MFPICLRKRKKLLTKFRNKSVFKIALNVIHKLFSIKLLNNMLCFPNMASRSNDGRYVMFMLRLSLFNPEYKHSHVLSCSSLCYLLLLYHGTWVVRCFCLLCKAKLRSLIIVYKTRNGCLAKHR